MESLEKTIAKVENILKDLKEELVQESERIYRNSPHKPFKKGDWIYKNNEWGKVYWVENECINILEDDGYAGIDLYSGTRGLKVCKRDDWNPMIDIDVEYLNNVHKIYLTGEAIQVILKKLGGSLFEDEIRKQLKKVGNFSFNE